MAYNNEDILTLAKAGFTAQQIAALNSVTATPAPAPVQATQPTPVQPIQVTQQAPAPEPAPAQGASVDDVLAAVQGLSATFKTGFLQNAEQQKPVTAESILAEIINPPTLTDK